MSEGLSVVRKTDRKQKIDGSSTHEKVISLAISVK